ncbi:MAG: hypothetical protein IK113_10220, partial [Bacteroidales bacterium]|nr:hypothetical protein [Bacteroidales bacterium]
YNWFDTAGNLLSDESTFMASKEGEYYCQVWDFGSDEMVESVTVQVYSEEFDTSPTIILQPEGMELEPREDGKYSFSLFCQAITFDGGSEDLKYEWYYQKIQADRTFVGEGAIIDAHEPGHYICVVTDTRSGGHVESEDAFVKVGLTIKDIAFVDHGGYYNIDYTICGGSKPYFVTVYERRIVGINDNGNYKYAERTIWREHDEEEGWQDGPYAETNYIWYHPVNGQYIPETHELYFQFFVVDDIGQVVHTDYFRCGYGGNIVMEGEN